MKHGDISNQPAPMVFVDARLLFELKRAEGIKGLFGKKTLVQKPYAMEHSYFLFREGIDVWVVVVPGSGFTVDDVDNVVNNSGLSFSNIIESDVGGRNIDMYLRLDYVHAYFHTYDGVPTSIYAPKDKYKAVKNLGLAFRYFMG
jgi:hypothetical protein